MTRVVWILGAGFSRPVGGPLLKDFFTPALVDRIHAWQIATNTADHDNAGLFAERCRKIGYLLVGGTGDWRAPARAVPWSDAEEFLEFVDAAHQRVDDASRRASRLVLADCMSYSGIDRTDEDNAFAGLARDARLHLAMACTMFCPDRALTKSLEKWEPYIRWATRLEDDDDVITFNYDRVVETVSNIDPLEGHDNDNYGKAMLLKLHGSVDWVRNGANIECLDGMRALDREGDIVLGTPGRTKREVTTSILQPFWNAATKTLSVADAIVFVGYRFPETDAQAKRVLLEAIAKNTSEHLRVHIVLGPARNDDVERLEEMLRWALRDRILNGVGKPRIRNVKEVKPKIFVDDDRPRPKAEVRVHRMWSQDFMTVFHRDGLVSDPP